MPMTERTEKGTWVEIHRVVLPPGQRASHVPEDTRQVPLEMKAKGFLVETGCVGEEVEVTTAAGRRLRGTLVTIDPPYTHSFGKPVAELLAIGSELRAMLQQSERER
jgi:hypothetical protein